MSGIAGWSCGNQSAGPKPSEICCRVKVNVLPGSCFIDVSAAGGAGAGAPAGRGAGMAYAHAGGSLAARSAEVMASGAAAMATSITNLRIETSAERETIREGHDPLSQNLQCG